MLTGKDLGNAIEAAIKLKGVKPADVARHFGIKPPSVNGWVSTGRIGKDKLTKLFDYFSDVVGPEHWGNVTWSATGNLTTGQDMEQQGKVTPLIQPPARPGMLRAVGGASPHRGPARQALDELAAELEARPPDAETERRLAQELRLKLEWLQAVRPAQDQ